MIWAAYKNHPESLKTLIAAGAALDIQDSVSFSVSFSYVTAPQHGDTALTNAVLNSNKLIVTLLVEAKARLDMKNSVSCSDPIPQFDLPVLFVV